MDGDRAKIYYAVRLVFNKHGNDHYRTAQE